MSPRAASSFAGATAAVLGDGPFTVVDIGDDATELAHGTSSPDLVSSAAFGARLLTDTYIESDPPRPEELLGALTVVEPHLDEILRLHPRFGEPAHWIGVGGTLTTMAAVELGLEPFDPNVIAGFSLKKHAAEDVFRTLVTESSGDRMFNPGLPETRVQSIVGGACATVALMRFFDLESITIGVRDGLVL